MGWMCRNAKGSLVALTAFSQQSQVFQVCPPPFSSSFVSPHNSLFTLECGFGPNQIHSQLFQGREDIELYISVGIRSDFQAKPQTTSPKSSPVESYNKATERGQQFPSENCETEADKKHILHKKLFCWLESSFLK